MKNYIRITFSGKENDFIRLMLIIFFFNVCSALNHLHEQNMPGRLLITLLLQSKIS